MEPLCRIELLGGLRLHQDGRLITRFRTHKVGALLAYLACYPRAHHPRETLLELLRLLRAAGGGAQQPEQRASSASSPAATSRRPTLSSTACPTGTVTFLLLDEKAGAAEWAADREEPEPPASALAPIVPILRCHGGYMVKEAGQALRGVFQSVSAALACAIACRRALEEADQEEADQRAVRMALHSGDVPHEPSAGQGRALLHVSHLLQAAHGGQTLCSAATAALLRSDCEPGIRLQDLGVFRLWDDADVETVFQVDDPRLPCREFALLRAAAGFAGHLPRPLTRFFGRVSERRRVGELLRLPETRLVTLTGAGGIGKTRLAIEIARNLLETFAGAVWFVPLADLTDADAIPDAILKALRLPRSPQVAVRERRHDAGASGYTGAAG